MDDSILARAKLLSQAATQVASELSNQANEYKAVVDARHREEAEVAAENLNKKKQADKERLPKGKDIGTQKKFRGAVISGSSLITTYSDMRAFVPRGSVIVIDGLSCRLQTNTNAEWTANRMELLEDFKGPTNLDAVIQTTITAAIVRRRSPKKNKAGPVRSNEILDAVSNLESSSLFSNRDPLPNPREYIKSNHCALSTLRSEKENEKKNLGIHKGKISSLNTGRSEYDTLNSFKNRTSNSHHPLNPHRKHQSITSASNSEYHGSPSRHFTGTHSPRSVFGGSTTSTVVSTVPPRSECTHLEEEQYQMMLEMDSLTEEEKDQARVEMNLRMADRGQRKATERVEEYKHRLKLPDTLVEDELYNPPSLNPSQFDSPISGSCMKDENRDKHLSNEELAERRRQARERYIQKQKKEDAIIEANFRAEMELKEQMKKKMEEKAKRLQEITAIRVAKYKAKKREEARKEKEAKELAIALKREKDKEATSEEYIQRMHARMQETEERLKRRKKDDEDMAHMEKIMQEVKLRELAAARHRTQNMEEYVNVGSKATPSPKKVRHKRERHPSSGSKLPRLDFSGANSKHVRNLGDKNANKVNMEDTDESESDNIVVTVGVPDNYYRKSILRSARNSKSEQSTRSSQFARQNGSKSDEPTHNSNPPVTHVVHITKPSKNIEPERNCLHKKSKGNSSEVQSRFEAFDASDDIFDDDENLSDDSLTQSAQPQKTCLPIPKGKRKPSLIPVFRGASYCSDEGGYDASSCISALTQDDIYSRNENSMEDTKKEVKKKKKKKKEVWKMKPIDVRDYVPLPKQEASVENR